MEPKFKKGDLLLCVQANAAGMLTSGGIYTFICYDGLGDPEEMVRIVHPSNKDACLRYYARRFVLASELAQVIFGGGDP